MTDYTELLKTLKDMQKTEAEKAAESIGEQLGKAFGLLVAFLILVSIVWSILHFVFALQFSWLQVMGAMVLINLVKNTILKPLFGKSGVH